MEIPSAAVLIAALLAPAGLSAGEKPDTGEKSVTRDQNRWCDWLRDEPGLLHDDKKNPWIQSFEVGGRFHYQVTSLEGSDVNGRDFNDAYDEYRRFRLETKTVLLRYFELNLNTNLVADDRFRQGIFTDLEWGYDRFDEASLEFDIGDAFGEGMLDGIKLKYGRVKLDMTEEVHMSSNEIYTIERSAIAERLGGAEGRPTGLTLELDKGDWELHSGVFSSEDDADFLGGWNDGRFYYASLEWKADKDFRLLLDYSQNDADGRDDALGYGWAAALSAVYDPNDWGVLATMIYGDNGGGFRAPITRRQGDFHGLVMMPWYWIIKDKLQAVLQYQYAASSESQGLQLPPRYIRAGHDDPAVDVDNGRGDEHHSLYAGLSYHFCRDRLKLMGGVTLDDLNTRRGEVQTTTWQIAFRTAF